MSQLNVPPESGIIPSGIHEHVLTVISSSYESKTVAISRIQNDGSLIELIENGETISIFEKLSQDGWILRSAVAVGIIVYGMFQREFKPICSRACSFP